MATTPRSNNHNIQDIEKSISIITDELKSLDTKQALKELEINSLVDLAISSKTPISSNKDKLDLLFNESIQDLKLRAQKIQTLAALKHDLISNLLEEKKVGGKEVGGIWEQLKNSSFRVGGVSPPSSQVATNGGTQNSPSTTTVTGTNNNVDGSGNTGSVVYHDSGVVPDDHHFNDMKQQQQQQQAEEEKEMTKWEIDKSDIMINREAKLGSGAFGSVFKGVVRGKEVAIKKLTQQFFDESILNEFKKEVCLMVKLRNPHLLLFMGACTTPGDLCIVTELMPKGSVHTLLRAKEDSPDFISYKRAILIARDTALGMNWLHLSKPPILHLDLKPANLLVDNNWTVKVADFGLSKIKKGSSTTGQAGSPLYMAPEMLLNKEYDEKCDVYSFGILVWELLTKLEPYNKLYTSYPALVDGVANKQQRPVIPEYFPTRLKDFLNRCWEHYPSKRPSFEEITKQRVLDFVLIDGLINDANGRQFWIHNFLGKEEIPWRQFYTSFCSSFNIACTVDDVRIKCLKLLLVPIDSENVSIEEFGKLLSWFGPLTSGIELLERVYSICSLKGFLGEASSKNVSQFLAGKKTGTYIIRFSSDPGCYALSYLNKNKEISHSKVIYRPGQGYIHFGGNTHYHTLDELIKNTGKTLGLKDPFEGGQFFALIHSKNIGPGAYVAVAPSKKI
eukprot:gene1514-1906_t